MRGRVVTVTFQAIVVLLTCRKATATRPPSPGVAKAALRSRPVPLLKRRSGRRPAAVLLQARASQGKTPDIGGESIRQLRPLGASYPAGWFGSFSQDESTYTYDGTFAKRNENPAINVMDGWNPQQMNPYEDRVMPHQWFEESQSGGYKDAWQTFYPAAPTGVAGNRVKTGEWFTGMGGVWQENYRSAHAVSQTGLPAGWFDDFVNQIDGFGRPKFPAYGTNPLNYLYWEERSVNTTLTCAHPGCTAEVSLQAPFDFKTEVYKDCKLSVLFHPTDFDDQYSGEEVQWVRVNNRTVSSSCHPFASGCNFSASRPLLPCVDDIPVDRLTWPAEGRLMPHDGILHISAKIPDVVDECAYNGNLLSAVPMMTCLVAPKSLALQGETAPTSVKPVNFWRLMDTCVTTMPLQCPTRGCAAEIAMPINSTCASVGKKCMLTITVNQTDFDNSEGTPELIDYIKVQGRQVASKLKPGQNPCKSAWRGTPVASSALTYTALKDYDVTSQINGGALFIEGKISQYVDECASNGYLLDAVATVTCSSPQASQGASLIARGEQNPADTQNRRNLRGHESMLVKMLKQV